MKPLRRTAEMELFGYGDKVAKVPQIKIVIHMKNIFIRRYQILDVSQVDPAN